MDEQPILVHNTHQVLYGNEAACQMFRCERLRFLRKNLIELIATEEFRNLARVHMQVLRDRGHAPEIEYPFLRCDHSVFWAMAASEGLEDGRFILTLDFTFEEWW